MDRNCRLSWMFLAFIFIVWTLPRTDVKANELFYLIDSRYDLVALSSEDNYDETTEAPIATTTTTSNINNSNVNQNVSEELNDLNLTSSSENLKTFENVTTFATVDDIENENITVLEINPIVEDSIVEELEKPNYIKCYPFEEKENNLAQDSDEVTKEDICTQNGCQWYPKGCNQNWESFCYTPQEYGYIMEDSPIQSEKGYIVRLIKAGNMTYFGNDSLKLTLTLEFISNERLHFKIADSRISPWDLPISSQQYGTLNNLTFPERLYDIQFENDPVFSFKIIRKSTGVVIFDTSVGGLTFSDQLIQIATKLSSHNLYGFSDESDTFSTNNKYSLDSFTEGKVISLFSKDEKELKGVNLHYTVVEPEGYFHSVIILHSYTKGYAQVQLLPLPGFIYRSSGGGGMLDFYIFLGPAVPAQEPLL